MDLMILRVDGARGRRYTALMLPERVEERLKLGEDSTNEFKGVASGDYRIDPHDMAKAIVSLANTRGGYVFLGFEDDGTVTGIGTVQQADSLMRQVTQVCLEKIHPSISCTLRKVAVRGLPILLVEVPALSPDRPYRAGHVYYIRDANRSREATRDELIRLLQSADYHFDEQPVEGTTAGDLDRESARRFISDVYEGVREDGDVDRYLRQLLCLDEEDRLTVVGVLFFAKDVTRWLPDARISAVRFAGTTMSGDFADRREIQGRLPDQISEAIAFLERHVAAPARIDGWDRHDLAIPPQVLREALLNAVTHRDYRMASQTRMFVFDDRVEVHNPGGLLNRLTIQSIRLGATQRRNTMVSTLLNRLGKRESIGLGIPEMFRLMREKGLPEPELQANGGFFDLVLRMRPDDAP